MFSGSQDNNLTRPQTRSQAEEETFYDSTQGQLVFLMNRITELESKIRVSDHKESKPPIILPDKCYG